MNLCAGVGLVGANVGVAGADTSAGSAVSGVNLGVGAENSSASMENSHIKVLSVAPIFAEVIRRVYHNESVNSLFV